MSLKKPSLFFKMVMNNKSFRYSGNKCLPFFVDDKRIGYVRDDALQQFKLYPDVFQVTEEKIQLSSSLQTFDDRSEAIASVLSDMRRKDVLVTLRGWRDECYNVHHVRADPPLFKMERSGACLLGVKQYGVHINGYIEHKTRGLLMWVATRSMKKPTFPGKLDQIVAGGLASGLGILECARKEAREEASIPDNLMSNLKPAGTVSYFFENERGLYAECQYVFDLKLPEDFTPVNADEEVESFALHSIDELKILITTEKFKFNCSLVILDFLIRNGHVNPDNEPYFAEIVERLHVAI